MSEQNNAARIIAPSIAAAVWVEGTNFNLSGLVMDALHQYREYKPEEQMAMFNDVSLALHDIAQGGSLDFPTVQPDDGDIPNAPLVAICSSPLPKLLRMLAEGWYVPMVQPYCGLYAVCLGEWQSPDWDSDKFIEHPGQERVADEDSDEFDDDDAADSDWGSDDVASESCVPSESEESVVEPRQVFIHDYTYRHLLRLVCQGDLHIDPKRLAIVAL